MIAVAISRRAPVVHAPTCGCAICIDDREHPDVVRRSAWRTTQTIAAWLDAKGQPELAEMLRHGDAQSW